MIWIKFGMGGVQKNWVIVSSMIIGVVKPYFMLGHQWIYAVHIYYPVWVKFGIRKLHLMLLTIREILWILERWRHYLSYGCEWNDVDFFRECHLIILLLVQKLNQSLSEHN
jgi:hypothetical protein